MRPIRRIAPILCLILLLGALPLSAAGLTLPATLTIGEGQTISLSEEFGAGAAFSSSNPAIVSVDAKGRITGRQPGAATVTVKDGSASAKTAVTVKKASVKIVSDAKNVYLGQKLELKAELSPAGSAVKVTWKSEQPSVAKVSAKGVVTPVSPGTADITATLANGASARIRLNVKTPTIALSKTSLSVREGRTATLAASVFPASMSSTVSFFSSDKKVATVNQSGVVTGVGPGKATITAKMAGNARATCTVTVKPTAVSLSRKTASVYEGKSFTLTAATTPADGRYTPTFSSSDKSVAQVDQSGVVTGVSPGKATITAKLKNGSTASCAVTVKKGSVSLSKKSATIYEGKTFTLTAAVVPADSAYTQVSFSSSDRKVASVDASGTVTGVKAGTAVITATLPSGTSASCAVKVKGATLKMGKSSLSLYEGKTASLSVTAQPAEAAAKIKYYSSNRKVATVDASGTVTGLQAGSAVVTAKLPSGVKVSCAVTVKAATIRFQKPTGTAYLGKEYALSYTLTPADADVKIKWKSSDPSVIYVDGRGRVRGLKKGTATVTATLPSGAKASINLTVKEAGVVLSAYSMTLYMDQTKTLTVSESPASGSQVQYTVKNSHPSVAEYADGVVRPKKVGTTTITFTHPNGISVSCKVEVRNYEVYSVILSPASVSVYPGETAQLSAEVLHKLAPDRTLTWTSSDSSVAKVSQSGLVTGVKKGKATITATAANGVKATCSVRVGGGEYRALALTEFNVPGMNKYMPIANKATQIASTALRNCGYSVSSVYTALPKGQLLARISAFGKQAGDRDVTVIYITTHGIGYNGAFYLTLPGWYEHVGDMNYAISSGELLKAVSGVKGHVVLAINACHSGGFLREQQGALSGMNITVICSAQWEMASGWLNAGADSYDFMSAGFGAAFGLNPDGTKMASLPADKNGDGALTADEAARYSAAYTASLAKSCFGRQGFVGDKRGPQVPQIFVSRPDQVVYEP